MKCVYCKEMKASRVRAVLARQIHPKTAKSRRRSVSLCILHTSQEQAVAFFALGVQLSGGMSDV